MAALRQGVATTRIEQGGGFAGEPATGAGSMSTPVGVDIPATASGASTNAVREPMRVLVVDDNRDAADSLAGLLRLDGHIVRVAHDPLSGLALADGFAPQVAVLDIGMPGMDGYELAARLHEMSAGKDCRLIALTGYGLAEDRRRSAAAGFSAHLVKPVDIERLAALIRTL